MAVIMSRRTGTPASALPVGAEVYLPVGGAHKAFIVVHQGIPDDTLYDASCNGTWLLQKNISTLGAYCTDTISVRNDYANSNANRAMDSFYNSLGTAAKSAVKSVKIPYRPGQGTSRDCNTGSNGLPCKAFLLSGYEVGFNLSVAAGLPTDEGAKLDYFEEGTGTTSNGKRIARYQGVAKVWWLRSPLCTGNTSAYGVHTPGGVVNNSITTTAYGYRPAIILGHGAMFDANGVFMGV